MRNNLKERVRRWKSFTNTRIIWSIAILTRMIWGWYMVLYIFAPSSSLCFCYFSHWWPLRSMFSVYLLASLWPFIWTILIFRCHRHVLMILRLFPPMCWLCVVCEYRNWFDEVRCEWEYCVECNSVCCEVFRRLVVRKYFSNCKRDWFFVRPGLRLGDSFIWKGEKQEKQDSLPVGKGEKYENINTHTTIICCMLSSARPWYSKIIHNYISILFFPLLLSRTHTHSGRNRNFSICCDYGNVHDVLGYWISKDSNIPWH